MKDRLDLLSTVILVLVFVCSPSAAFHGPCCRESQKPASCLHTTQGGSEDPSQRQPRFFSRREVMGSSMNAAIAFTSLPAFASESVSYPIKASWTAITGLNSVADDLVAFDASAYKAMKDDPSRTPQFNKALQQRIGQIASTGQERITVVDLGTGPYALFAMAAAEAGADKVYAIEANAEAARLARETVARSSYAGVITVLEGLSTVIELPEQVDICVAEIVGSISSEEGAYATIYDAHRFVKEPEEPLSWIPNRIQTYAAPASYSLHNLFTPPAFDWSKLNGEPVRFNCRDYGLNLMAEPVLVEDFDFSQARKKGFMIQQDLSFSLDGARMDANEADFLSEFKRGQVDDAASLSKKTAHSVSGIAFWPRLVLNNDISVNSRIFPGGGHQRSHWQTVLPIMADTPIGPVKGGDQVRVKLAFDLPQKVNRPPSYSISGEVIVQS